MAMRTNIDLDDSLTAEAMALSGARTKREVVELALRELVQRRKRPDIGGLLGLGGLDPAYDHKLARGGQPWVRVEEPRAAYRVAEPRPPAVRARPSAKPRKGD